MLEKIKKHKVAVIVVAIIAVAAIIIGVAVHRLSSALPGTMNANFGTLVQPLEKHDLSKSIQATGTVESQNTVEVTSEVTGKIAKLNVVLGDHVNKGDVLCVFDDTQIKEQISQLEQQQSRSRQMTERQNQSAKRALDQARSRMDSVNAQVDSAQWMLDMAAAAGEDTSDAWLNLQELKAQQADAFEALLSAQDTVDANAWNDTDDSETAKQLTELRRQLQKVSVVAEQSGIITELHVSQGSVPSGPLMVIRDDSSLKVRVSIKEKDILNLQEGMTARITADALQDTVYSGRVERVINFATASESSYMDGSSGSGGYSAEIYLEPGSRLLLGMAVKVEIMLNESGEKLSVAYDSIETDEDGVDYVYRALPQDNGEALIERVDVVKGEENDYYTEIICDQLSEGDLIVAYPYEVMDGDKVAIMTPEEMELFDSDNTGMSISVY